jgi:coatomer protein complex subunit gamma
VHHHYTPPNRPPVGTPHASSASHPLQTLLKTGSESSVDRLMKQIATFMSEITDEFKVVVVKAIHELCLRYTAKYRVLLMFLSTRCVARGW